MVEIHTVSLAYIQRRTNEAGSQRVSFIEDARRMLNGAMLSVSKLYSITGVDWLIAASINFSSTTALRFADLEGLPSNNTMGPVNARPLQDVRLNHDEGNREERQEDS